MKKLLRPFLYLGILGIVAFTGVMWYWVYARTFYPLVEEHRNTSGNYQLKATFPVSITEGSGAVCNDKFYVVGGLGFRAQTYGHFYAYDPASDEWEKLADLPEKRNHAGVVSAGDKVYVVGGFGPLGIRVRGIMLANYTPQNTLFIYYTKTRKWSKGEPLPEVLGAGGVTVADGCIWYTGGINKDKNISDSLYRYDLQTGKWAKRPSMPSARDHLRMEAVGKKLYAISGHEDDLRFKLNNVECFDIETNQWTRKKDIPTARGGFGSVVHQSKIYVFGGENIWKCYDTVECYDTKTDKWEKLEPMPEPRHGILAGIIKGEMHLISGGLRPRISVSGVHRVYTPNE